MNDPHCSSRHPHEPPVLLHQPHTVPACVPCLLHTVTQNSSPSTLRLAALATLQPLSSSATLIHSIPPLTISKIHSRLLHTLFQRSTPSQLIHQLTCFIPPFSDAVDATTILHSNSLVATSIATALDAVTSKSSNTTCSAIPLLAALLTTKNGQHRFSNAVARRQQPIIASLLSTPPTNTQWQHLTSILPLLLPHPSSPSTIDTEQILDVLHSTLPPRRHPSADACYLTVIKALLSVSVPSCLLFDAPPFFPALHAALLACDASRTPLATAIITTLARDAEDATVLTSSGTLDFLIEALRESPSNHHVFPAVHPLAAIIASNPPELSLKWHYIIPVLSGFCSRARQLDFSPLITCFGLAFEHAPLPALSDQFEPFVSFTMRLVATVQSKKTLEAEEQLSKALTGLSTLLSRLHVTNASVHIVLTLCEQTQLPHAMLPVIFTLLSSCIAHFTRSCEESEELCEGNESPDIAWYRQKEQFELGLRLSVLVFDNWGSFISEQVNQCEEDGHFLSMREGKRALFNLFSKALHPYFVRVGVISQTAHTQLRLWCWSTLPIRLAFSCQNESSDTSEVVQEYIHSLVFPPDIECSNAPLSSLPMSKDSFLTQLKDTNESVQTCPLFAMVEEGVKLGKLETICDTDSVLDALVIRLKRLMDPSDAAQRIQRNDLLWVILTVCSSYRLPLHRDCFTKPLIHDLVQSFLAPLSEPDVRNFLYLFSRHEEYDTHIDVWDALALWYSMNSESLRKHATMFYESFSNSRGTCQSVLHAFFHSANPQELSAFVNNISEITSRCGEMVSSFERLGLSEQLHQLLDRMCTMPLQGTHTVSQDCEAFGADCNRISAIISVLSKGRISSNSEISWHTTRSLCDAIIMQHTTAPAPYGHQFLEACMRYLLILISGAKESRRILHVARSGVIESMLSILTSLSSRVFSDDDVVSELLSSTASFMVHVIEHEQLPVDRQRQILDELAMHSFVWEALISYDRTSLAPGESNMKRIANCMTLFNAMLVRCKDATMVSQEILLQIAVCTGSSVGQLRDSAFVLLTSIKSEAQADVLRRNWSTFVLINQALLSKLRSEGPDHFTEAETAFLLSSIQDGSYDIHLQTIESWTMQLVEENSPGHSDGPATFDASQGVHQAVLRVQAAIQCRLGSLSRSPTIAHQPSMNDGPPE